MGTQGLRSPWNNLVVHGGHPGNAGQLVAALGSEWVALGTKLLYRAGRLLIEDLLRAHEALDTDAFLRSYDEFRVVIVNEPDLGDDAATRCFELFVEDRTARGSLVIACAGKASDESSPSAAQAHGTNEDRWLQLLRIGGGTLLLNLS